MADRYETVVWRTIAVCLLALTNLHAIAVEETSFTHRIEQLKGICPKHFLPDVAIVATSDVKKPTVYGEPNPPEGYAGPDATGRHPTGIYFPRTDKEWFAGDISNQQWVFHEMFHLHSRRLHDYDRFIAKAFPDDTDPLVKWMRRDPYHRAIAREEAFINLITFADPARTDSQRAALREWYDYVGATNRSYDEIKRAMDVIEHPETGKRKESVKVTRKNESLSESCDCRPR